MHAIDTNFNNFAEDQPASTIIQFPGFLDYRNLAGIVWQGQAAAATAPTIANAPGTCTGIGGDTNCAQFSFPGASCAASIIFADVLPQQELLLIFYPSCLNSNPY
jgi:hypothetical protein